MPASSAPGVTSCIRLRIRKKVDFPHPEGPISAVTIDRSIKSETLSSTRRPPNQALTLSAWRRAARFSDWRAGRPLPFKFGGGPRTSARPPCELMAQPTFLRVRLATVSGYASCDRGPG